VPLCEGCHGKVQGTDPLPDFDSFSYNFVSLIGPRKGRGWEKLKECERRLTMYRWAERRTMPQGPQQHLPLPRNRVFLDDCLSAFLMALEAALQHTEDQLTDSKRRVIHVGFNQWLSSLPAYDLQMRGLRTLRHFAGHVEIKPLGRGFNVELLADKAVEVGPGWIRATESTATHSWLLPRLDLIDLQKLARSPLTPADLPDWNTLVGNPINDAASILEHGLRQAQAILLEAEKLL